MRALTIKQPWAQLIAVGAKKFETRSWGAFERGHIAIHAGKSKASKNIKDLDPNTYYEIADALGFGAWDDSNVERCLDSLPHGCIIATAELVDYWLISESGRLMSRDDIIKTIPKDERELMFGNFSPRRYAFELANVKMLKEPIPAKGRLGFWEWNAVELRR
jgi:hypothetical protein